MAFPRKWVKLGKVLREWGVRGEVKCVCFNPDSTLFSEISQLYIEGPQGFDRVLLEGCRPHDQYWRVKFKGFDNPEAAKKLRGRFLALPREELPECTEGEFYLSDLEGLSVKGPQGQDLGKVWGIHEIGDSEAILVGEDLTSSTPIPYEKDFVEQTDWEAGSLTLTGMGMELIQINQVPS